MGCSATRPEAGHRADLARGKNPLAKIGDVREAQHCHTLSFSGSPVCRPPASGGFALVVWVSRSRDDYGTLANHFARVRSVAQNTGAFKEASANPSNSRHLYDTAHHGRLNDWRDRFSSSG